MKLNYQSKNQGLTLIEALIWFAIFAAVVAGVFSLYSNSRDSNNASTVNKELSTIFSQTENLYATESTAGLTNTVGMQLGVFPSSIKSTTTTGAGGTTTLNNVFGGTITLAGVAPSGFTTVYTKVPKGSVCSSIVRSQKAVGWDSANTINYNSSYTIAAVGTLCGVSGSGTIDLTFTRANAQT